MKGVLNSVDMQVLIRGDNMPKARYPRHNHLDNDWDPCVKLVIFSCPLALSHIVFYP